MLACAPKTKKKEKNALVIPKKVVDSLLGLECHPGTVAGLPPQDRPHELIH